MGSSRPYKRLMSTPHDLRIAQLELLLVTLLEQALPLDQCLDLRSSPQGVQVVDVVGRLRAGEVPLAEELLELPPGVVKTLGTGVALMHPELDPIFRAWMQHALEKMHDPQALQALDRAVDRAVSKRVSALDGARQQGCVQWLELLGGELGVGWVPQVPQLHTGAA